MKTIIKLLAFLALALSARGVSASAALAAPPTNDTFANATSVAIGFSEVIDTTEATTDSDDAQLNASCGLEPPATDASVWYVLQGSDKQILVAVSQSDYSAGFLIGVGTQGNLQTVACDMDAVDFFAAAGVTYYVLAIDTQFDEGGNGGLLNISFNELPPPPTLEFTVNPRGTVDIRTEIATISGTYTCTNADGILVAGSAEQNVGRITIFGPAVNFFDFGRCDGTPHSWTTEAFPRNGKFAGGKLITNMDMMACNLLQCTFASVEETITLRGVRSR